MHKHRTITFIIEVILVTLAAVSVGACGGSISLDLSCAQTVGGDALGVN